MTLDHVYLYLSSALPSLMAEAGSSTEDIMTQGRWSSEAWRNYAKSSRAIKLTKQIEVSKQFNVRLDSSE